MELNYSIEEYQSIADKLRQMNPYSDGVVLSENDTILMWDKDWHIEIHKRDYKFSITLKRISEFFGGESYTEYYKFCYFEDKHTNYLHLVENKIIKSIIEKRFYQVMKDYEKGMKEVYEC